MRVLVKNIDRFSFLGREYHPTEVDVGKSGTVLESYVEAGDSQGYAYTSLNEEDKDTVREIIDSVVNSRIFDRPLSEPMWYMWFFLCRMDDGSLLELSEEEIDLTGIEYDIAAV